jgi:glycosyltransferase involved in cell wall biosynthesis
MASRKLRVAFVTTTIDTGGAEAMLVKVVKAMDKGRFQPTVIVLADTTWLAAQLDDAGAKVIALGLYIPLIPLVGMRALCRVVNEVNPDVIQGWMLHGNLAAQIAGSLQGRPVIWSVRYSRLLPGRERFHVRVLNYLMQYVSRFPWRIVYNSHKGRALHETMGYDLSRSLVIPNGFDLSRFAPDSVARARYRAAWRITPERLVIGMVARYHPMKDHSTLLEAATILCKRRNDIVFVLAGRGCVKDNPKLMQQVERLGLHESLILLGEREDIHSVVNGFDIGVLSSASEGFPNALGELMACGLPCVATDVGDARWIVGDTGRIVPPQNPRAFADAVADLIDLPVESRRSLGTAARARVEKLFSIAAVVQNFEALYSEARLARTRTRTSS